MNQDNQLEIHFDGSRLRVNRPPQNRRYRAKWWFQQMRQAVDSALDWQPVPSARPEQIWFDDVRKAA